MPFCWFCHEVAHIRTFDPKNRSNFGEVDVAPAKTDKVNKVQK